MAFVVRVHEKQQGQGIGLLETFHEVDKPSVLIGYLPVIDDNDVRDTLGDTIRGSGGIVSRHNVVVGAKKLGSQDGPLGIFRSYDEYERFPGHGFGLTDRLKISVHPVNAYLGVVTSRLGRAFTTEVTEITEETMILALT
jgi:hypothetical protein